MVYIIDEVPINMYNVVFSIWKTVFSTDRSPVYIIR